MKKNRRLIGIKEAADMLDVSPLTLRRWDDKGILKAVRVGTRRDRKYDLEELEKLIMRKKI